MHLDTRSTLLLKEILMYPGIKINNLCKKFSLTRSQVNYSIRKINEWLKYYSYPELVNDRELGIFADPSVEEILLRLDKTSSLKEYILTSKERVYFILLLLLSREEELSLFHFSSALKVSKNTVLNDLKKAEDFINNYNLQLLYSRMTGYYLDGDEFDKRRLLIDLIPKVLNITYGFSILLKITNISIEEVNLFRRKFERIENELQVQFTDEKINELPILFLLINRRINLGKSISFNTNKIETITNTNEFKAIEKIFPDMINGNKNEHIFLTIQLLGSSLFKLPLSSSEDRQLRSSIRQMLYIFERQACVSLQDIDDLVEKIYLHMKPASYRIRFKLYMKNPILNEIINEYGTIHHFVKLSVSPIEYFLGEIIPEDELSYITILITSWLHGHKTQILDKPKAIVVCPNGISVSRLLFETLRTMFPAIRFIDNMSIRDFYNYKQEYDIVFSTVQLFTKKKFFLVKPFISDEEKVDLKARVDNEIFGVSPFKIDYTGLIEIIKKHTNVQNEDLLIKDIKSYLGDNSIVSGQFNLNEPALIDLITSETITIKDQVKNLEEAVYIAAKPLLENKKIEQRYVDAIIKILREKDTYMFMSPSVAIPHASPEDGVNEISMSLLVLRKQIKIDELFSPKLVILIATTDRKRHLKALLQLNELCSDEKRVQKIVAAKSKGEVLKLINEYSY